MQLIILETLTITTLWKFTENVQKNHIIFWQYILRYHRRKKFVRIFTCLKTLVARQCTKKTLTDELKILDNKIKASQAQYDLGREAAKMSALSSKYLLEKYEYLTGEDLRHRPSVLEKMWVFSIGHVT